MEISGLWQLDASALAQGFRSGAFTPLEALVSCLERSHTCQPVLNAFVLFDEQGARQAARDSTERWQRGQPLGVLDGVPVSLKDNLHARGLPTSWGSALLKFVPASDELPVARLRAAGAVIFGKTNLPEFALQGITDNPVFGTTRNPWNKALTPGGSSGGGAAAVAAGCGPLALVTDGGGSARRPAAHTGVVGFKPSAGMLPRQGGLPEIFLDYEVPGILARSVDDAKELLLALADPAPPVANAAGGSARILFIPCFGSDPVDPGIAAATARAAQQLGFLGHHVEEAAGATWAQDINEHWPVLSASGLAWMLQDASRFAEFGLRPGQQPDFAQCSAAARASLEQGRSASAPALFAALNAIHELRRPINDLFAEFDFLLTPATAALPWPVGQSHPHEITGRSVGPRGHAVFTAFANAAGLPAISLPAGRVGGLPTGIQIVARRGADAALLALSRGFEQACPWRGEWPIDVPATMAVP